jgi:hypothetical protein
MTQPLERTIWYSEITVQAEEFTDLTDRVLVFAHWRASGRNQLELDRPIAFVFTLRDTLLLRFQSYWSPDEALEAAGLRE